MDVNSRSLGYTVWLTVLLACAGCSDGAPVVLESSHVVSPAATFDATVELVDNGMGFGLGALYYEVHVETRGATIKDHGDHSKSSVFYVIDETSDDIETTAKWVGARHLVISYDGRRTPGRLVRQASGVTIEYRPINPSRAHRNEKP